MIKLASVTESKPRMVKCGLCRHQFRPDELAEACTRCALLVGGGCQHIRCPKCGYEMPAQARLPRLFSQLGQKLAKWFSVEPSAPAASSSPADPGAAPKPTPLITLDESLGAHSSLSPLAIDHLKSLYLHEKEGDPLPPAGSAAAAELLLHRLVRQQAGGVLLTRTGLQEAREILRRYRLAERLQHDVLDSHGLLEEAGCDSQHPLHPGLEESVCSLLGHPTTCPHGRPIPPGPCCKENVGSASAAVLSLAQMKPGESGSVAYLGSRDATVVRKLMVMGVLPGAPVQVIQTSPCVAIQVEQTQIGVDRSLAKDVFVRRTRRAGT